VRTPALAEKPAQRPSHWKQAPWEQMAQENPLFAVMTTEEMAGAPSAEFTPEQVETLFEKGRRLFRRHIAGALAHAPDGPEEGLIVEYGCGVGRMLNAALEAGYRRVAGIDISPTMLAHCRRLVPEVEALYPLDEHGRSGLEDGCASAVFSYAVVQHISELSRYMTAFDEMRRILKPGGLLVVQLNCTDFEGGDFERPGRTENHETFSLHFHPGEEEPYLRHEQDQWSGVYIGSDLLTEWLKVRQVHIASWRRHGSGKSISVWIEAKVVSDSASVGFTPEQAEKSRRVFRRHVAGALAHAPDPPEAGLIVQYGCGDGRLLNAALESGWRRVAGLDASPALLAQCRRQVPEVEGLHPLDAMGRSDLPDDCAAAVFSYGALARIPALGRYLAAIDEMCRILKPGGLLIVQLNCADFEVGDFERPGRTENHETWSLHFRPGEEQAYLRHEQDPSDGVRIGSQLLASHLQKHRMRVTGWRAHGLDGSMSVWLHAKKRGER